MALARSAEAGLEPPVRTERNEAGCHPPLVAAQDLLHRTRKVIVAKLATHAAEVVEGQLMRIEKRLLRGSQIGVMKRRTAGHRTHRKHLQLDPFALQIGARFIPVNLDLDAECVALRHERLATSQALLLLAPLHILANCPLFWRESRHLRTDPFPTRFAVWRCLRGAFRSAASTSSMNAAAGAIFETAYDPADGAGDE